MDLLEGTYSEIFDFPEGQLLVMADLYVSAGLIELREFSVFPLEDERLSLGTLNILRVRRKIEHLARQAGFSELRIIAERVSGASPGRHVLLERHL